SLVFFRNDGPAPGTARGRSPRRASGRPPAARGGKGRAFLAGRATRCVSRRHFAHRCVRTLGGPGWRPGVGTQREVPSRRDSRIRRDAAQPGIGIDGGTMFGRLLPRETSFFDYFDRHAALTVEGARE